MLEWCSGRKEEAENDTWAADAAREADLIAADKVRRALTPEVRKALEEALDEVFSNDGCDALGLLVNEALPAVDDWMDALGG